MARPTRGELQTRVIEIVEPLLAKEGYELVEVELSGAGASTILRLFIDKQGGVTLDDCASVSEAVSAMLDVEDPLDSAYNLEVSSPGLDRPLRKPDDYRRFLGRQAKIKTYGPVEGAGNRKVFVGKLLSYEEAVVRIDVDGTPYAVPHTAIAKANLIWEPTDEEAPEK